MAAHARLKNELTEDEKYHISWAGSIAPSHQKKVLSVVRLAIL